MTEEIRFADPYKKCDHCKGWVDGARGLNLIPCGHQGTYTDVCPSWSPVDGCNCAWYSARNPSTPPKVPPPPPLPKG